MLDRAGAMLGAQPIVLVAALLLLAGVLLSKTSTRWGVPSLLLFLLLFLLLGMMAGSEGLLGIAFDDYRLARDIGVLALAFILFSGGLGTSWPDIRRVLWPGVAAASAGTVLSAMVLGVAAAWILDVNLVVGLLLGSVIASTDAAAVFVQQMGLGLLAGLLLGRVAVVLINRLNLEFHGLYPVLIVVIVLVSYEGSAAVGGSGFLAAYVTGLTMLRRDFVHKRSPRAPRFQCWRATSD